eukprot:scaffold7392_cov286-Pinguiococcus_pyrenoidosus.AAC.15
MEAGAFCFVPSLGLNRYVERYQGQCATCDQLWECIQQASDELLKAEDSQKADPPVDLGALMLPWLHQAGFPLLCTELAEDGEAVTISQVPFQLRDLDQAANTDSRSSSVLWPIPIGFRVGRGALQPKRLVIRVSCGLSRSTACGRQRAEASLRAGEFNHGQT